MLSILLHGIFSNILLKQDTYKQIKSKLEASNLLFEYWKSNFDNRTERMVCLALDCENQVVLLDKIFEGNENNVFIDEKIIRKIIRPKRVKSIILAHNHPHNTLKPSSSDYLFTYETLSYLTKCNTRLIDHLIFTENSYISIFDSATKIQEVFD